MIIKINIYMARSKCNDMSFFDKYAYDIKYKTEFVPTCSSAVNNMLLGGIPYSCIAEIYGHEGSGKSSFFLSTASYLNKLDKYICIIDTEGSICSKSYLENIQVNFNKTHIYNISSVSNVFDLIESALRSNKYDLVIVDSIASTLSDDELEKQETIGSHARIISSRLKYIVSYLNEHRPKTSVILINQMRSKINDMWKGEMNYTTAGGKSIKYYSSLRLEIDRYEYIKHKEEKIGFYSRIKVVKSRFCAPHVKSLVPFLYGDGYSRTIEYIDELCKRNIVLSSGGWTTMLINDQTYKFRTKLELIKMINDDVCIQESIKKILNL